jgi:peptidoglycan/LPS O-acetylase OafA/YrhL
MGKKRITWIDGLKGVASLFVVCHHFIMGYYPAAYQGAEAVTHFSGNLEIKFAQSPLAFFTIGDFWVSVFCLVSGLVISYQVMHMTQNRQFSKSLLKRYPRLMLPVFALSAIVYVMLHLNLFWNGPAAMLSGSEWLAQFYQNKTTISDLLLSSIADTWIVGMSTMYSNAFWMLADLFAGSFMAYILAAMGREMNNRILYVYIGVAVVYLSTNSRLTNFALGVLIAYIIERFGEKIQIYKNACITAGGLMIFISVILGSYPVGCEPTNAYRLLNHLPDRLNPVYFYHMLAAALLVMGIYLFRPLAKLLSAEPFLFLGKISYSIYIIHIPVLFSVSAWLLTRIVAITHHYNRSAGLVFVISMLAIVSLAWVFYQLVEKNSSKLIQWIVDRLTEREKEEQEKIIIHFDEQTG